MNIEKILNRADVQRIIQSIEEHCENQTFHEDNYGFLAHERLCKLDSGMTKVVLIRHGWDFVIKIPRYYSCRYSNVRDYCELEVQKYASAEKYRVQQVLLETAPLTTLGNGIKLYVQWRYTANSQDYLSPSICYNRLKRILHVSNESRVDDIASSMYDALCSTEWLTRVVQLYGKRFARSFAEWTQENEVGDLHDANTAWLKGRPVLADYSGYYG